MIKTVAIVETARQEHNAADELIILFYPLLGKFDIFHSRMFLEMWVWSLD